tara:strand:- start:2028 stop:2555 length:528 start_codon:yes stop_codon:yes gene_type:complete
LFSADNKVLLNAPFFTQTVGMLLLKARLLAALKTEQLMEITLEYWNALAKQIILISSLLSGFSITVVANVLVYDQNDTLTNRILKSATLAAGSFLVTVFAMIQISMMTTPGGYLKNVVAEDFFLPRAIGAIAFLIGLFSLTAVISLAGWKKSKSVGIFTTVVGIITLILVLITLT